MKFALTLFGLPIGEYAPVVRHAEELGFDSVWFGDHVVTPTSFAPTYPYDESGSPNYSADTPIVDVAAVIAHVAAITDRIRLGPGVLIVPLRTPLVTARAYATLQDLCNGRLVLGVGVGWMREEFDAVGEAYDDRGQRTNEILEILRLLWRGQPASYSGTHYVFDEVQLAPMPCSPIPFVVGGTTDAALRRTARFGQGWFAPHQPLAVVADVRGRLLRHLAEHGRDEAGFEFWYRLVDPPSAGVLDPYRDAGVEHLVLGPFWAGSDRSAPLEEKLAAIERAADWLEVG